MRMQTEKPEALPLRFEFIGSSKYHTAIGPPYHIALGGRTIENESGMTHLHSILRLGF